MAQDNTLDSKLVQYVRDAKKSGQKQPQAQQKAIKAGWSSTAVSQAVAYVYGNTSPAIASNAPAGAPPPSGSGSAAAPNATGRTPIAALDIANAPSVKLAPDATPGPSQNANKAPVGTATPASGLHAPYEYQIGAGEVLQISVWREPEASAGSVVVRPDGMISTPLIKEIQVAGLTPAQAEKLITEKLVKVIQEPDVTVVVTGINSKKLYLVGAVKKEGTIPYTYSMTIMQAIAEAGGLTDYAKRSKIYVLRNENGKESRLAFNYDEVLKGNHLEMNVSMLPGDTLVVPH
jgi:polysaccharide export outer membrane protein